MIKLPQSLPSPFSCPNDLGKWKAASETDYYSCDFFQTCLISGSNVARNHSLKHIFSVIHNGFGSNEAWSKASKALSKSLEKASIIKA